MYICIYKLIYVCIYKQTSAVKAARMAAEALGDISIIRISRSLTATLARRHRASQTACVCVCVCERERERKREREREKEREKESQCIQMYLRMYKCTYYI
jgi:hypothetical protein